MKRFILPLAGLGLIAIAFAFIPGTQPVNGEGQGFKIDEVRPANPAPVVEAPAKSPYHYGTRQVCDGNRCYTEAIATVDGYPNGIYVRTVNGWEWEPGETYEIHDGVAFHASLPGEPVRKAVRVTKRVSGVAVKAGRVGLRVGTSPARFLWRRCRGGC